jgi:hypothetical protein
MVRPGCVALAASVIVACGTDRGPRARLPDWVPFCRERFAGSLGVLGPWGYPTFAGGTLATGALPGGVATVSYRLERSSTERYLVEVTGVRPDVRDMEWVDHTGQSPQSAMFHGEDPWPPGRLAFYKHYGGHVARLVVTDSDVVRRHNFAAAFMTAVDH